MSETLLSNRVVAPKRRAREKEAEREISARIEHGRSMHPRFGIRPELVFEWRRKGSALPRISMSSSFNSYVEEWFGVSLPECTCDREQQGENGSTDDFASAIQTMAREYSDYLWGEEASSQHKSREEQEQDEDAEEALQRKASNDLRHLAKQLGTHQVVGMQPDLMKLLAQPTSALPDPISATGLGARRSVDEQSLRWQPFFEVARKHQVGHGAPDELLLHELQCGWARR